MPDLVAISEAGRGRPGRPGALQAWAGHGLAIARRHPRALAVSGVVHFAAALAVALLGSTRLWESSGTMLYAPLTGPEVQGLYVPPDLKTLVTLTKSPASLKAIRDEFHFDVPLELLERVFRVSVPTGTKMVEFELRWGNARTTAAMVNRLMELFRDRVAEVRRQKIGGYVEDLRAHHEICKARSREAGEALDRFFQRERTGDIGQDLVRLGAEIQTMEAEAAKVARDEADLRAQLKKMEEHLAAIKARGKELDERTRKVDEAQETMADNRRRRDRLRERIAEERVRLDVGARLSARRAEYERIVKLAQRKAASREELERARAEVEVLTAQVEETETIRKWRAELERLDERVVPKGAAQAQGSSNFEQTQFKQLELELLLTANREEASQLAAALRAKRRECERLVGLQQQYRQLARTLEAADAERQAALLELTAMRKLQAIKTPELSIVTPATPGPHPVWSNRKLILVGVWVAGMLATIGALSLLDARLRPRADAASAAWRLGLPVLARLGPPSSIAAANRPEDPAVRLLALRLRQAVGEGPGLLLFSGLNASGGSAWLVSALARSLALRDERVLILDLAGHADDRPAWEALRPPRAPSPEGPGAPTGLHAFLVFDCDEPDLFVFPTALPGVDCMPAGEPLYDTELLATDRLVALTESLRDRYSLVLAVGPRADAPRDLRLLAPYFDGLVFHARDGAAIGPVEASKLRQLASRKAPILGAVVAAGPGP